MTSVILLRLSSIPPSEPRSTVLTEQPNEDVAAWARCLRIPAEGSLSGREDGELFDRTHVREPLKTRLLRRKLPGQKR
jgi:hypothetical protein